MRSSALPVHQHGMVSAHRAAVQRRPALSVVPAEAPQLRVATVEDVPRIHALLEQFVGVGLLLPRSIEQVRATVADFVLAISDDRVVGTVALRHYSPVLAEIGALAVADELQGTGLGRRLVEAAVDTARTTGVRQVFALTMQVGFFHRLGFATVDLARFPQKLAADCAACPRRAVCAETAVALAV